MRCPRCHVEVRCVHVCRYVEELIGKEVAAGVPANKIVVSGFSQGGTMSLLMLRSAKYTLAGVIGEQCDCVDESNAPHACACSVSDIDAAAPPPRNAPRVKATRSTVPSTKCMHRHPVACLSASPFTRAHFHHARMPARIAAGLSARLPMASETPLITGNNKDTPVLICHGDEDEVVRG